jgi:iron complex transport system ATP-binding protein
VTAPELRARNLGVRLGGRRVLDGVDLALAAGELVGLVGPNGSGKTTLLRSLVGAQPLHDGHVDLDGDCLGALTPTARARRITLVSHGASTDFPLTVRELVALGRLAHGVSSEDDARIERAMRATGVDSLATRHVAALSAGELQRAHLARALAQASPLLLLDEPTANLDPRHQLEALTLLASFVARGGGALVAMHDLGAVGRTCQRVIVLQEGRVVADGAPATVLDEARIGEVFGVRARVRRGADGAVEEISLLGPLLSGCGAHRESARAIERTEVET